MKDAEYSGVIGAHETPGPLYQLRYKRRFRFVSPRRLYVDKKLNYELYKTAPWGAAFVIVNRPAMQEFHIRV